MTPTERAAVAEAIAALEPFAHMADRLNPLADAVWDVLGLTSKNGDLRRARAALASLRAVAPAPADTTEYYWLIERRVEPPQYAGSHGNLPSWTPDALRAYRYATKKEAEEVARFLPDDIRKDAAVTQHGFMYRFAPAGQSDAGRDGVIEEEIALKDLALFWQGRANALSLVDSKRTVSDDMTHDAIKIYMECADELRRALASAPSETAQGPCETTLTERFAYPCCKCGTYSGNLGPCRTFLPGADPERCVYCDHKIECHEAVAPSETVGREDIEELAARFRAAGIHAWAIAALYALRPLPTADRDAIREALKTMIRKFENCARHAGNEQFAIDSATEDARAALGLLGEG